MTVSFKKENAECDNNVETWLKMKNSNDDNEIILLSEFSREK